MKLYDEREEELGEELMRALERYLLLQIIDQRWREHLYDMDYLREGIHLRGFAQIEPIVAYKNEAFTLFQDLMNTIWSDFARMIYNVEVEIEGENGDGGVPAAAGSGGAAARSQYTGGTMDDQPSAYGEAGRGLRRGRGRDAAPGGSSAASTSTSSSAATTRAGAAQARSSRSATARERRALAVQRPAQRADDARVELRAGVACQLLDARTPDPARRGTGGPRSSPRTRRRRG